PQHHGADDPFDDVVGNGERLLDELRGAGNHPDVEPEHETGERGQYAGEERRAPDMWNRWCSCFVQVLTPQCGGRFSMNACTPSSAAGSIMLQAIACEAASYAASIPSSACR